MERPPPGPLWVLECQHGRRPRERPAPGIACLDGHLWRRRFDRRPLGAPTNYRARRSAVPQISRPTWAPHCQPPAHGIRQHVESPSTPLLGAPRRRSCKSQARTRGNGVQCQPIPVKRSGHGREETKLLCHHCQTTAAQAAHVEASRTPLLQRARLSFAC